MSKKAWLIILTCLLFLAAGCATEADRRTIADYAADEIVVRGLTEADFSVSISDLAALPTVERSASASRANGEQVHIDAVGPLLDTFLAAYGKSQRDFSSIRFTATDDYSIAVDQDVLSQREIVLAISDGGQPLSADDQPLRVVIPGERAMYWVRHLCRIDFESGTTAAACRKVVFLEAATRLLPTSDYEYYGVTDQAVTVNDLLNTFNIADSTVDEVTLSAADGLSKTETLANFRSGMIKYTGADSPRFVSADLPEGMQVYDLVLIGYGAETFVSLPQLMAQAGSAGGVFFSDLLRESGFVGADNYQCTSVDGGEASYSAAQLAHAYLYLDERGWVTLAGIDGDDQQADLLSIEAGS